MQTKDINELLNIKELTLENKYFDGKSFSYIPNEIFKLVNLESLYIDYYSLEEISNDIVNLVNLKNLTIEDACFEKLPDGISNLTKLKTLNFIYCDGVINLKEFPKEINFAKDFALYFVNKNYKNEIKEAKFENVYKEFPTKEGRRIDILIVFDKFEIIIENKINANALENQLGDYYIDRNNGKLVFLVYLTRGGYKASKYSIGKVNIEKDKIYYLSHDYIAKWIEDDILNKYEFLKFDKKYQSICSALIQIRDNEKIITNPNRENNMEREEIKKFFEENNYFETLLKDKSMDDKFDMLENFKRLLENAKNVILDKRVELVSDDINYSLKVIEFIKSVQSNKGEDYMKGAKFYGKEYIENNFTKMKWSGSMEIPIFNGLSTIELEQHINYHLCISVCSNNNDIIKKLKEEPIEKEESIKTEIGKILDKGSDRYSEDEGEGCIYSMYIDTENYEPKDIADKIIKLYELLNKNFNK